MNKIRSGRALVAGAIIISGVALACEMLPMPPMIVNVSAASLTTAVLQGFSNPARAAALTSLDSLASSIVGAANWRSGNYIGPVTYKVGNSMTTVTENKDCNSKAIDQLAQAESGTGGGGGDSTSGSGSGSGGGTFIGGSPYITDPNTGVVTIGEIIEGINP